MRRVLLLTGVAVLSLGMTAIAEDIEIGPFKAKAPAEWKSEQSSSNMRLYQAKLPKVQGDDEDAELVVFWFGAGGGGGVKDNIDRWKKQVQAPKGKTIDDISSVAEMKINGDKIKATYLDIKNGIYLSKKQPFNPNSPTIEKDNFRFLGVIVECEKGPFFIRVTGPGKTVEKHKKAFDEWLKNLK